MIGKDYQNSEVMSLFAALSLGTVSFLMYIGLPIIMGVVADQHGFNEEDVGWVASADLGGLFCGSVFASVLIGKLRFWRIAALGIGLSVFGNFLSVFAEAVVPMCFARLLAELGSGICHALSLAALSRSGNTSRSFTLLMVIIVAIGSVWLFALPQVAGRWGDDGIFLFLAAAYVVPGVSLVYSAAGNQFVEGARDPNGAPINVSEDKPDLPILAWGLVLGGVFFFYAGATSFWAFAERVGSSISLGADVIALTFTVCNILTLAGCWLAYWLGSWFGPYKPSFAVLVLAILVSLIAAFNLSILSYTALIFFFFQAWAMTGIFQWAVLADIDATGRAVALAPAAQGLGMSIGPAVSGSLLGGGLAMSGVAGVNAAFMVLTFVALYCVYRLGKDHRESYDH